MITTRYHRQKMILFLLHTLKLHTQKLTSPMYLGSTSHTQSLKLSTTIMVSLHEVEDDERYIKNLTQYRSDLTILIL